MKTLYFILLSLLLLNCNNRNSNTATTDTKAVADSTAAKTTDGFSDLSVYHLPAVWTTQNGDNIELKDLKGNVLVVVMIYTSCKTACPIFIKDMREIRKRVDEQAGDKCKQVKYLLVSIDPETDARRRRRWWPRLRPLCPRRRRGGWCGRAPRSPRLFSGRHPLADSPGWPWDARQCCC